jgi:hypothetical protein
MRDWPPALTLGKAETTLLMEAITHNLGVEDGAEHMEAIEAPAAEAAMNTRYDQWIKASSNPSTLFYFYFLVFFSLLCTRICFANSTAKYHICID